MQIAPEGVYLSVWTHPSKQQPFKDFIVSKSLSQVYQRISMEPHTKLHEISSISAFDIERIRQFTRPNPVKTIGKPHCLHALIGKNYSNCPDSTAISSTKEQITYTELGQKSAIVAELLKDRGVAPGEVVGLCMQKSPSALVVVLGILRSGAGYAPIDSFSPSGRITQIVEKADIRYVVTEDHLRDKFEDLGVDLITSDNLEHFETPKDWHKEFHTDPSTPTYVMFTSGSTGVPKGVAHHHEAVSQSLLECIESLGINQSTRFLQFASLAFDASIFEVFAPLVAGGCLCIPSHNERSGDLESAMNQMGVTDAWLTPSMVPHIQPENLPSLRNLAVGGEPPSVEILSTWGKKVNFTNLYGLTEAGVWDTMKPAMKPNDSPRNIGRGIGRVTCWIADPANIHNLRPVGAEGELLVQSPYLAHSYLKDEKRQKETLIDPSLLKWASLIHDAKSTRVYRTGDLAKFTPEGDVVFVGRKTGFVKIRGLRVDLMEIEKAINETLKDGRSAVVLSGTDNSQVEIAAFCELVSPESVSLADEISHQLCEILPEYMIPTIFIPTEKLPLTLSKKIDRQRLFMEISKMDQTTVQKYRKGGSQDANLIEIPTEKSIAFEISNIIADMLEGKDQVYAKSLRGKDFSLGRVGLTSMQLVSLANSIKRKYGKIMDLQSLRQAKLTVCGIEDILTNRTETHGNAIESRDLLDDLAKLKPKLKLRKKTVFLTSITGFLGSQILRYLLNNPEVGQIIGLVRSSDEVQARKKVQQQAEMGKWWRPSFDEKIEIWLGDLSKPRLGLQEDRWDRLFGNDSVNRVDGIIHNGARVNWLDEYEDLEGVNVHSTADILSGLSNMRTPCQLIYVSGGYLSPNQETHAGIAKRLASASGYDQTKFMSELLLNEYNQHLDRQGSPAPRARTVIPGFIVGTREEGIAQTEDFFWRFVYSIVRIRAISEELGHLTVAGVDQVSALVSNVLFYPNDYKSDPLTCLDGVSTSALCDIVSKKLDVPIRRIRHDQWMQMLQRDIEEAEFDHPFSPVMQWFDENVWQFCGDQEEATENSLFATNDIRAAIEKSLEYMTLVGYMSTRKGDPKVDQTAIFTRS
jgi:amino acid adenylation domain-containing protein/thioester reductase-like protein